MCDVLLPLGMKGLRELAIFKNNLLVSYHGYMTDVCFFFVLYWFTPFVWSFGPLPSENPRCAPAMAYVILDCRGESFSYCD